MIRQQNKTENFDHQNRKSGENEMTRFFLKLYETKF